MRRRTITVEEIIKQIQWLANELGRFPTYNEFNRNPWTVGISTVTKYLHTWNNALKLAGLEPDNRGRSYYYSREALIAQVQNLAKEYGRTPSSQEFDKDKRTARYNTIINRFGTWNCYLAEAGLKPIYPKYSDEDLIAQFKMLKKEKGKAPTMAEFDKDKRTACASTIKNRYGTWNRFRKEAEKNTD